MNYVERSGVWLLCILLAADARAGISYATDATEYLVPVGEICEVRVYLEFTGTDATKLLAEEGLFGTGVALAVTDSVPNNIPPVVLTSSDIRPNIATFDDPFGPITDFDLGFVSMLMTVDPFAADGDKGATGQVVGPVRRIELGVVRFSTGAIPDEVTTMVVGDYDPSTADTVTWKTFQILDEEILPATITIRTVGDYCPTDFNKDGFVDTDDFTAWVLAFIVGGDDADFDGSGFVDTDDFTAFVYAFEAGC